MHMRETLKFYKYFSGYLNTVRVDILSFLYCRNSLQSLLSYCFFSIIHTFLIHHVRLNSNHTLTMYVWSYNIFFMKKKRIVPFFYITLVGLWESNRLKINPDKTTEKVVIKMSKTIMVRSLYKLLVL